MSPLLTGAAGLAVVIALAHSYLGERYILMRLFRRDDLPRLFGSDWFTRRTLRFAWHLTSIAWWGFALVLLAIARRPAEASVPAVLAAVSITFAVSAVVAAGASRGKHLSWIVFGAIAALTWLAR